MVSPVLFSKAKTDWGTPRAFFEKYNEEFNFDLDAAADSTNALCPRYLGPGSPLGEDALIMDWPGESIWLNPPYDQIAAFMKKAWEQNQLGKTVVCLIPSRTDTRYWHSYIEGHAETRFIQGRIKFVGGDNSAPFPSVVVIYHGDKSESYSGTLGNAELLTGDSRDLLYGLAADSIQTIITSPPYFQLRDYGIEGQIGLSDLDTYISDLVEVFRECRRVLKPAGSLWLNLGDSWANTSSGGTKTQGNPEFNKNRPSREATKLPARTGCGLVPKNLIGVPWRVALALQADGWILRSDIIWHKTNPMPESVRDRPTKSHEYLFLLTKSETYYYDSDAIREPCVTTEAEANTKWKSRREGRGKGQQEGIYHAGAEPFKNPPNPLGRNKRSVWTLSVQPFKGAHFACMPQKLVEPAVLAGSRPGDLVLDPFSGCYDDQTEVLTDSGWKLFIDVLDRDLILSLNPDTGQAEYTNFIERHKYTYCGEMVAFKGRSVDLLVTPDHRMYGAEYHNKTFGFISASELSSFYTVHIPTSGSIELTGSKSISEDLAKLIGFYLGDGYQNKHTIRFGLTKDRKKSYLRALLLSLNIPWREYARSDRPRHTVFSINKTKILNLELFPRLTASQKCLPSELFEDSLVLSAVLDGLMNSDGHTNSEVFFTSSKQLADDVQRIYRILGRCASITQRSRTDTSQIDGRIIKSSKIQYSVHPLVYDKLLKLSKRDDNFQQVLYNGVVHCLTLEKNNIMYVRRNGRASWCGNSGTTGLVACQLGRNYIGLELNPAYNELARKRLTSKGISVNGCTGSGP